MTRTEVLIADLAAAQWGLLTTAQAAERGVSRLRLSRLAKEGLIDRYAHGVYRWRGAGNDVHAELRAAWLSLDPARSAEQRLADLRGGVVVSHASAASLHGLGDLGADRHEFMTSTRRQSQRAELRLHRGTLAMGDVTVVDGLPVTTPARTVVDLLADSHDTSHVATVLADAARLGAADLDTLADRIAPYAGRHGFRSGAGADLLDALLEDGGLDEESLQAEILSTPAGQRLLDAAAREGFLAVLRTISGRVDRWQRDQATVGSATSPPSVGSEDVEAGGSVPRRLRERVRSVLAPSLQQLGDVPETWLARVPAHRGEDRARTTRLKAQLEVASRTARPRPPAATTGSGEPRARKREGGAR